jgi:DNA-binding response OmpR family regulator
MTFSILLVDDNSIQAATRKAILNRAGFDVIVCAGAREAIEQMNEPDFFTRVGLIITDHLMPEINGPAFVTAVRTLSTTIPVLVLSGLPEAECEYEGLDVICRCKPFAPDALISLARLLTSQAMPRTA